MTDIIEHGARLLAMDDGWDGPDSKQPDKWVVLCGVMLLRVVIEAGYPTPILYPTHEGGMRAEWDCGTQTHNVSVDIGGERLYFHALQCDQIPQPLLQGGLHQELRGSGQLRAIGREHQLHHATAEVGPHHPFAGRSEEHLFDETADVGPLAHFGATAAAVDLVRVLQSVGGHVQLPITRVWAITGISGVPLGTQTA